MNPPQTTKTANTDPFDEGLDRLIWSLSDQSLQWDGEISQRRRDKPREVLRLMRELVAEQHAVDDAEAREYAEILDGNGMESVRAVDADCEFFALRGEEKEILTRQTRRANSTRRDV